MDPLLPPGQGFPSTDLFGAEPVVTVGPHLPEDYRPAPRPKVKSTTEDADAMKEAHQLRLSQAREMAEWLDHTRTGYFEIDQDDVLDGLVELMPITTLRADHEYTNGVIAGMDPYVELANRETTETEEALAIEDAVYHLRACEERQYADATGHLLRWAEPDHLQRFGCLVGLDTINPDNAECGLDMSLIDPLTVFPVFEGRNGLSEVFRVYEDTPGNIIGNYGGRNGAEYERISKIVNKIAGKQQKANRLQTITVMEQWNRDWCQVVIDGEKELLTRRHGYARVPFTIIVGGFDMPPGVSSGAARSEDRVAEYLNTAWGQVSVDDYAVDVARQYRPFQWRKLKAHAIREAVHGRNLTAFRDARDPVWIHEVDPMTRHQMTGDIVARPGHVIEVLLGNKLSTMPTAPGAEIVAPLMQALEINAEQGPWSQLRAGMIPPQTSDSALGTMLELGGADRSILVSLVQQFYKARWEWRLQLWEEWGAVLGRSGDRGTMYAPQRQGYAGSPMHALTPEMLQRAGHYLNVQLFHWRPSPAMAQYLGAVMSAGLISKETARRKLRVIPDPDRERMRIEDEQMHEMPAIAIGRALQRIDREIEAEIAAGDDENADRLMESSIQLNWERDMMMQAGVAPPGAGGPGMLPPGMTPPVPPPGPAADPASMSQPIPSRPPDINQQGLSLPGLGVGVGRQGGRPQGGSAGKEATAPTRLTAPVR